MESLSPKVIRSGFWSLGGNWLSRGLGIVKLLILARLLSPLDFGILGLAILSINVLNVFSETGIESALIQKEKISKSDLDTAWTITVIRGLILFSLLFAGSGWFATYFENNSLESVLKVMAAVFLFQGFNNIGLIFFKKELEFQKTVLLDLTADAAGAVAAILLAFYLKNVWALVAGTIFWAMVKCIGSYKLQSYRPTLRWEWHTAGNLLTFGKHVFWISIMAFVITNVDDALVGKVLGLTMLGFYTVAFNISSIPVSSFSGVLSQVFFPAYATIQGDSERIQQAFRRAFDAAAIILLPLTSIMLVLAPSFTILFLGQKWSPIIQPLQVLCLFALFRGISSLCYPLHLGLNRPDIQSKIKTLDLLVFAILIYPLTVKWGILGTSCAMAIVYLLNMIMNIVSTMRLISIRWQSLATSASTPIFISFIVILTGFIIQLLNLPGGKVTHFVLLGISSCSISIGLSLICRKKLIIEFIDAFRASS
jgi:O-antigen/teichoic acid export membrane protein